MRKFVLIYFSICVKFVFIFFYKSAMPGYQLSLAIFTAKYFSGIVYNCPFSLNYKYRTSTILYLLRRHATGRSKQC
jgi:hypothetical protein